MTVQPSTQTRFPARKAKALPGFRFSGPLSYRLKALGLLYKVSFLVTLRHLAGRPTVQGWTWAFESANSITREMMKAAFALPSAAEARTMLDSLLFNPSETPEVERIPSGEGDPKGTWFIPRNCVEGRTMLYLHGGGYAFHAKTHGQMISLVAEATGARTFSVDYRLTPEHPHPAQREDAMAAYRWLLGRGASPSSLVIAGDSAGGHLTIMTLVEIKKLGLPLPALGVGLCPWTDTADRGKSLFANNPFDWVQGEQTRIFSTWYHGSTGFTPADTSAFSLPLAGLPPLYLQAGGREILVDMIRDFAAEARRQGVDVTLDEWETMTHDFQAYGNLVSEARDALLKLGEVVDKYAPGGKR
jgi:epsilon-lactone hydrolase